MWQDLHVFMMVGRMVGEPGKEGVIALTMIDLLSRANEEKKIKNVLIKLAYIEIYN